MLNPREQLALKEYCQAILPVLCHIGCLRKKKKDEDFTTARKQLSLEMDLVNLIRNIRYLKAAVESIMTPEKARKLKLFTKRRPVDESEMSDQVEQDMIAAH